MHEFALLLVEILVILAAARLLGSLFIRMRQPRVLGEMTAGILLGPTVLGNISASALHRLFPPQNISVISGLSQIGLVLYLFCVGLELETSVLISYRRTAAMVSWSGILVPFVLGALLAWRVRGVFMPAHVPVITFALFVGVAMSITAFPVLVRILNEQRLLHTRVGILAIASAAVDDVTSWCLLAVVVAMARSASTLSALPLTVLPLFVFIVGMLWGIRPALLWLRKRGWLPTSAAYLLALASASLTEVIGVHALFGAFLAGLVFPRAQRKPLESQIQPLSDFLLPLFFAFSGLRTSIPFHGDRWIWIYAMLILAVAIVGKFGACTLAARFTGLNWREASALGALMNTRGLVELIILNIGFDLGVISPTLFSLLVSMALLTTFMTAPLLHWTYGADILQERLSERSMITEQERSTLCS